MTLADYTDDIPEDLAPSSLFVLRVLVDNGPMTTPQLRRETLLSIRTVNLAIDRLRDEGLVESKPDIAEPRRQEHSATLTK